MHACVLCSVEPIILSVDEQDEVSIADVAGMIASAMKFQGKVIQDTTKVRRVAEIFPFF